MNINCWIKSRNVRNELKELFFDADQRVSQYFAANPSVREEHLESRLLTYLERDIPLAFTTRINDERDSKGLPRLSISFKHITHGERITGADIGLIAELDVPGEMKLTKAALLQSKRLYPIGRSFADGSRYEEIFRGSSHKPQWERLLEQTPSAVYLLFGPDRLMINRTIRDFGSIVIPASTIKGFSNAGFNSLTATEAYQQGLRLKEWIVDEFICCNVGDSTEKAVLTARGGNEDFGVRNTLEISIQAQNIERGLFR